MLTKSAYFYFVLAVIVRFISHVHDDNTVRELIFWSSAILFPAGRWGTPTALGG